MVGQNSIPLFCRKLDAIHASAREGEADDLLKHIAAGVSVNLNGKLLVCHLSVIHLMIMINAHKN